MKARIIDAALALFLMLSLQSLELQVYSKSSSEIILKAAKQLLDKENQQQGSVKCKAKTDDHISSLRENGQVEEAITCLVQSLAKNAQQGWKWSQLAVVYASSGGKSKAKTCFKQAAKLGGKISQVSKWHVLAPFISGKTEGDGDPLEAFGGIRSAAKQRYHKKVYYSELAVGGEISWKTYEQIFSTYYQEIWTSFVTNMFVLRLLVISEMAHEQIAGNPVQISPRINWNDLIGSLGARAVTEWQGWAVGEFAVNTEKEEVSVQCLGVSAVYVDDHLLAGDVYRRNFFWSSLSLHQGIHSVYVRLRANPNQVFQCTLHIVDQEFVIHEPSKVPDLVDGYLIAEHMPVALVISNHNPSKWLSRVRFKQSGSNAAGLTVDTTEGEVNIAPGQTAIVPFYMSQNREEATEMCSDIKFKVKVMTSAGSDEVTIPIRCRKRHESFIMTFEDHDGSIQQAAVIEPLGSCDLQECRVVLTLHGTGVQAQNQADSYKRMEDGDWLFGVQQAWVLAPTRHGAHNWEGPGSLTAITALKKLHQYTHGSSWPWPDENKAMQDEVIFAGHSMGGHGAWHLATHYPQLGKAVVSMAGWNTKEEYGDSNEFFKYDISSSHIGPSLKAVLEMCFTENNVDKLVSNVKGMPVLARIGSDDRTVHPFFVRRMFRLLSEEGVDVTYSELKGKEHWWWDTWKTNDGGVMNDPEVRSFMNKQASTTSQSCSADRGSCSDKPSMKQYTLTVFNPANGGFIHGFQIIQQIIPLRKSTILMTFGDNVVDLSTSNVLTMNVALPEGVSLVVDGTEFSAFDEPVTICLNLSNWDLCEINDVGRTSEMYGPARRVAEKPFVIVTGTQLTTTKDKLLEFSTYLSNLFFLTSDTIAPIIEDTQLDSSNDQNLIIIGNMTENIWTESFLNNIPISQLKEGFHLNLCNFSDVGILSLAPNGREHLALILMGSSVQRLEDIIQLATPTIPPMARSPYSNMIPDFLITGPHVRSHGPGGYHCAGFWGNSWEYRQELASCIC